MEALACSSLASYRHCIDRMARAWPGFRSTHADRLRHGNESEKVAEAIIEDLFTQVLDWDKGDLMYQVGYADIVISRHLAKYLVVEVKRPGALLPGRKALEAAIAQARRYAGEQQISSIATTDGRLLYAADVTGGGMRDRLLVDLAADDPPLALWWLSVHGIYRTCSTPSICVPIHAEDVPYRGEANTGKLLHPKYNLPADCFAYVPDASRPGTWKLPFRLAGGVTDHKRLPKAIQAILSNYRGTQVKGIPERDIADVLLRLARTAWAKGLIPPRAIMPAPIYQQLSLTLQQLGMADCVSDSGGAGS